MEQWRSKQSQLEEQGSKIHFAQSLLNDTSFDGQYGVDAAAPTFVEAFRAILSDRVLDAVLPITGHLRGASLTVGFTRDTRSVALLPNSDWLLKILEDTGSGGWLNGQGTSAKEVVGEAIVETVNWARKSMPSQEIGSKQWKWGHHHSTLYQHIMRRHTMQTAILSAPVAPEAGGLDTPFRAPYAVPKMEFRIVAHGDTFVGKKGMKGVVKMPFQSGSASTFRSCLRLVSDLASPRGLAWSAGIGNVFSDQADPQGLLARHGLANGVIVQSVMSDFLAKGLQLWRWAQHRLSGVITPRKSPDANESDLQSTSAGPGPWTALHSIKSSRAAVVRLVKGSSGERRLGEEL